MQLQTAEFKLIEIINFFAPGLSLAKWFGNDSKQRKQMKRLNAIKKVEVLGFWNQLATKKTLTKNNHGVD